MNFKYLLVLFCWLAGSVFGAPFFNPIVSNGADPWVVAKDGFYYYTQTTGASVKVRQTRRIAGAIGISNTTATTVFTPSAPYNQNVWAPELHYLQGKWYIYYAADDGTDANHRLYVAEASSPLGPYTLKGKIADPSDCWAIDGTVLEKDDGTLYLVWSGWTGATHGNQNIYIAPMSNPWTISGPRVNLSTIAYSWEYPNSTFVNEGPEILKRNGKTCIVYSANGTWTDNYCLGLMVNTDGNYLNAASWTKNSSPIFKTYVGADGAVYAPGHCGFTHSLDGTEDWIIYHAAQYQGAGFTRDVRAQKFTWLANDTPNLGQPIPPGVPVASPSGEERALESATLLSDGRLAVCTVPTNGVVQRNFRLPGTGSWSGWGSLGGSGFKKISTVRYNDDRLAVLGIGSDARVWLNAEMSSGGAWMGWAYLGGPAFSEVKGVIYSDQRLAGAAVGDGTAMWLNSQSSTNGSWGGWVSLGGSNFWNVDLVKRLDDRLVVLGVGSTDVWINAQATVNGSWNGWQSIGGTNFNYARMLSRPDGRLAVFAVGSGTAAWINSELTPEGAWSGWTSLAGSVLTRLEPILLSDGRMAVFATGDYSAVTVNQQATVNGAWSGWVTVAGSGFGSTTGVQMPDGQLAALTHNFGTAEYFNQQSGPSHIWGGWSALVGGAEAPKLSCSQAGDSVTLQWSTNVSGFKLEQSVQTVPSSWGALTNVPTVVGTNNSVTLTIDPAGKVFRMRHP
ncbi:family 43 glycosylhydrolase [Pedosphaera parvula]|uniref:Alpha-N-arabinofuranosidase n=1 Tax=Pedosphaera parvula (strain Ellin514) TaxID=320771 RepID=B9XFS1_PEDPL|nr:family 43 glycosylhydrolase [Pedosphaera parvula]EEF61435.1 Alpha-N-arabinofuranosidase [Pedosphaera parvula Ellin514]